MVGYLHWLESVFDVERHINAKATMKKRTQKGSGLEQIKRRKQDDMNKINQPTLEKGGSGNKSTNTGDNQKITNQSKAMTTPDANSNVGIASASRVTFSLLSGRAQLTNEASVPGEVEVQKDNSSLETSSNSCGEWYETIRQHSKIGGEAILASDLIAYVRNDLFPKLKFFMDNRQLMFSNESNTICYQICKDMGLREEKKAQWWEMYKTKIVQTLNSKRADVTSAIKKLFMSK